MTSAGSGFPSSSRRALDSPHSQHTLTHLLLLLLVVVVVAPSLRGQRSYSSSPFTLSIPLVIMPSGVTVVDAFKSTCFMSQVWSSSASSAVMNNLLISLLTQLFTDLIRHGKNHVTSKQQSVEVTPDSSQSSDYSSRTTRSTQPSSKHQQSPTSSTSQTTATSTSPQQQQPMKKEQIREQAVAQNVPAAAVANGAKSEDYTKQVEAIVQEERETKSKMPVYKGLENYKLLDKMGE